MKTDDILQLDCRVEENQEIIQRVLKQIKPLSKYSDEIIPFEKIEKAIIVMEKKYTMRIREFVPDIWANKNQVIWRATLIDEKDLSTKQIYGLSVYEVFAKTAIQMYANIKTGKVKVKEGR